MKSAVVASEYSQTGLAVKGFDAVEVYVEDLPKACELYEHAFSMHRMAEKRNGSDISIFLEAASIRLILTGADDPHGEVAKHLALHGDTVHDIAFQVADAAQSFEAAVSSGATIIKEPFTSQWGDEEIVQATVKGAAGLLHTLISRSDQGQHSSPNPMAQEVFAGIDHAAVCLETGTLDDAVEFYTQIMAFEELSRLDIRTGQGGMRSVVVQSRNNAVKFTLIEPMSGGTKSQIRDFLTHHNGPGVQHLAVITPDIVNSIELLRARGISFLDPPQKYYESISDRLAKIDSGRASRVQQTGIMLDGDNDGMLFQIFARPLHRRPTFFWEFIQRDGAKGFGARNVQALYEAIEQDQPKVVG